MGDGINTLREIGAQKIHNDTHISREYAQAIIHETFDGLKKVQFMGFISILEREYDIDLSDLRAKGQKYFDDLNRDHPEVQKVFIAPNKKKDYSLLYKIVSVAVFISFVAYTFIYLNSIPDEAIKIDDSKIESATKNLSSSTLEIKKVHFNDENNADEQNTTVVVNTEANETTETELEADQNRSLKILPKNKIWAGLVEIETNKKYQKIFTEAYDINTSKNWLLLFGSGTVYLEVNGEVQKFQSNRNMRFKYNEGEFTKITVDEFMSLNKGRKW